jgi:TolB-like protein/cytochrome c-type biogenesis protein CcmH/NrfG
LPKAYTTKRSRRISASIAILLALLTWFLRDYIPVFPGGGKEASGDKVTLARPQVYYGPANSIAVLPFTCTSSGFEAGSGDSPGNETANETANVSGGDPALADGIAESLIDLLVGVSGLQVTSSNSSFFFRDTDAALPVLAERLKVRHILGGCARMTAGGIEISARLFDVKTKTEKWSKSFNGKLDEVFIFQDEITAAAANAVVEGLAKEAPGARVMDPQAWLLFIEGRYRYRLRGPENLRQAEMAYKRVLDIEPEFAPAMLELGRVYMNPVMAAAAGRAGIERAREMILGALRSDPELAGAYLELSRIRRAVDWDWQGSSEAAQKALEFQAGNADVLSNASTTLFTLGKFDPAVVLLNEAIKRDPLVLQNLQRLGLLYEFSGKYEEALLAYRMLLGLNPDYPAVHAYRARVMLAQAMPESALEEAGQEQNPFWQRYARILSLIALERRDEAGSLLQQMVTEHGNDAAYQVAEIYAFGGDIDEAFNWLDRAYRQRDGGMSELIGNHFLSNLENDVRWRELLTRVSLVKPGSNSNE